ncbi:hypothetical protein F4780DRAFT_777534 [Xylariomycetidae sp. FL0641]|nr:hypothetical protein F4780DRAFT_777534 [Xylariomycetidae sp. FL0641]
MASNSTATGLPRIGNIPSSHPSNIPSLQEGFRPPPQEYRPFFRDDEDYQAKYMDYMAQNNVPDTTADDRPATACQLEQFMKRLYDAFLNKVDINEPESSRAYKAIFVDTHYTEVEIHLALRNVLNLTVQAQQGLCDIPQWLDTNGPVYRGYGSFNERFDAIELALKESKSTCQSIFTGAHFSARLAWNPIRESKRKEVNMQLNKRKNITQKIGLGYCKRAGIHRNGDGALVDQNGTVILEADPEPTPAFEQKVKRQKRRQNPSERARITDPLLGIDNGAEENGGLVNPPMVNQGYESSASGGLSDFFGGAGTFDFDPSMLPPSNALYGPGDMQLSLNNAGPVHNHPPYSHGSQLYTNHGYADPEAMGTPATPWPNLFDNHMPMAAGGHPPADQQPLFNPGPYQANSHNEFSPALYVEAAGSNNGTPGAESENN